MARYGGMTEEWVRSLAATIAEQRRTIASAAREAGVSFEALRKRVRRLRLVAPAKRGDAVVLTFRATCPCGLVIETSQVGESADTAWRRWHRRAVAHAREAHDMTRRLALKRADDMWIETGDRSMSRRDPDEGAK